ncbi:hypothetical protein HPB48_020908 [Haemaphysalis longicornis]|uniref:Uncharacterized protein n=1 Tax=Haemaphysalis longicornis TaxID=44386 RepID=A0A9J6FS23_HAELO|nr:hypothetical protein HPB48_020908 [Haemaphysalis longicornis]
MDQSEKAIHEAFVTTKEGCSPVELVLRGGILIYSTFLHSSLADIPFIKSLRKSLWFSISLAVIVQCVPFMLTYTLLVEYWACVTFTVVALAVGMRVSHRWFVHLPPTKKRAKNTVAKRPIAKVAPNDYPGLTAGRAQIILFTIFGILAVDFPTTPRSFAKTEKTGFSPMDIGPAPRVEGGSDLGHLCHGADPPRLAIALALACTYEACLLFTPLASFLDSDDRTGFLVANKEGLVSIAGYVSLHLASAAAARTFGYKPRNSIRDWVVTALQCLAASAASFAATYALHTAVDPVSRRLANLPYCLWMLSLGLFGVPLATAVSLVEVALMPAGAQVDYNLFAITRADKCPQRRRPFVEEHQLQRNGRVPTGEHIDRAWTFFFHPRNCQ